MMISKTDLTNNSSISSFLSIYDIQKSLEFLLIPFCIPLNCFPGSKLTTCLSANTDEIIFN